MKTLKEKIEFEKMKRILNVCNKQKEDMDEDMYMLVVPIDIENLTGEEISKIFFIFIEERLELELIWVDRIHSFAFRITYYVREKNNSRETNNNKDAEL